MRGESDINIQIHLKTNGNKLPRFDLFQPFNLCSYDLIYCLSLCELKFADITYLGEDPLKR